MGIAGAVGFFAREPAYGFIQQNFLSDASGLPPTETMEWVVAFGIFLVIIGVFSAVFALFAPKPKSRKYVSESALKDRKAEMERERRRAKRRKAQMRQKMQKANRRKADR